SRRRHTRFSRDWSSDVCSSDLACEIKPDWGAAVCRGDFGHFGLGPNMGFGSAPITEPIMLSRNGRRWEYTGQTTIRSGAEVRVRSEERRVGEEGTDRRAAGGPT